ncbi:MAG TPA: S41 family peptidase [Mycobacteriales bacterium]|nr:S41 family peptidase [Mycobacteriales bacterium]
MQERGVLLTRSDAAQLDPRGRPLEQLLRAAADVPRAGDGDQAGARSLLYCGHVTDPHSPLIRRLGALLVEHYVFPEVARDVSSALTASQESGRYDVEAAELAARVTEGLQSVSGDRHLRLLHSADPIPDGDDHEVEAAALTSYADDTAGGVRRVERMDGNIGLVDLAPLLFPPSMAAPAVTSAMNLVATTAALVVDVRDCIGGDPTMVALLCSYLFDEEPVHLTDVVERAGASTRQYWTLPHVPGRRFGGAKPVYVLTGPATFSGAEELAYDLQQLGRATVVGERTRGGAHPRQAFRVDPHPQVTIPVARAVNPVSGTNCETCGVQPDVDVGAAAALDTARALAVDAAGSVPQ